ncbi:MAG: hypothetical protein U5K79_11775 [Cyclobacteriaceae bacterium]|nr:hypothetical protein [Cyclobacteriaceae bacterium]
MKYTILVFALFFSSMSIHAQSVVDDVIIVQSLWGKEKRALVADYMAFDASHGETFWPAYNLYEASRKELGRERLAIMDDYVQNQTTLSDKKATELMNRAAENSIAMQKLFLSTFKSMSKIIGPAQAAKFIQIENYLMLGIQLSLQENLPFLGDKNILMQQ